MALMSASFGGDVVDGLYKKYMPTEMTSSNTMPTTINLTNPLVFMLCASNRHLLPLQVQGFGAILPCDGEKIAVVTFSIGEAFRRSRIPTHPRMEWSEETTGLFRAMQSDELILRFRDVVRGAGPPYLELAT